MLNVTQAIGFRCVFIRARYLVLAGELLRLLIDDYILWQFMLHIHLKYKNSKNTLHLILSEIRRTSWIQ